MMESKIDILLVDDRRENLLAMEALLERRGLNIVTAQSGNDALSTMLDHDFAVVLLDVQMPDMDGFEVAQLMKQNEKTRWVPIIFLTALSKDKKFITKGYRSGAVDYLLKPLDTAILQSKVDVFLQLHRQKRQLLEKTQQLDHKVLELLELKRQLETVNRQLEMLTVSDALTGIPNRRRLDQFLESEWRRSQRNALPLSLIMIDIDRFKEYNDHYGHPAGDVCLRKVAQALQSAIKRPSDLMARYGGEEFTAVLAETDSDSALRVVELLAQSIHDLAIPHPGSDVSTRLTVSQGLAATVPTGSISPRQLLQAADDALYAAKDGGRNRFVNVVLK